MNKVLIPVRKAGARGVATALVAASSVEQGLAFLKEARLEFMPDMYQHTYGEPDPRLPVIRAKGPDHA